MEHRPGQRVLRLVAAAALRAADQDLEALVGLELLQGDAFVLFPERSLASSRVLPS